MPRGYRLMWAMTDGRSVTEAQKHRFHRITADRVMIYAYAPKHAARFQKTDDAFVSGMTAEDQEWLRDCLRELCAQKAQRNAAKVRENDMAFMEAFERELEAERMSMAGKGAAADGGTDDN